MHDFLQVQEKIVGKFMRNVGRGAKEKCIFSSFAKNQKLFTVPDLFKFAPKSKILIKSVMVKGGGQNQVRPPT